MRIFITGRQGTGKTSVIRELQKRGYTAYNTDELPGVTRLQDKLSGEFIDWPHSQVDWEAIAWNWQPGEIEKLLASDSPVFIAAVTGNQADFYDQFDKLYALTVPAELHAEYIRQHEHKYTEDDVERIVAHAYKQQKFFDAGAKEIRNDRPVEQIVDEILRDVGLI